jgi:hypothetical protein
MSAIPMTDPVLVVLESAARSSEAAARVALVLERVERKLATTDGPMAWEPIPLADFDRPLPEGIQSAWIFVIRAGAESGAERHPNSHQRSLSLLGRGEFHLREAGRWKPCPLVSDAGASAEQRWLSIPPSTWHRVLAKHGNWGMLSFHTVPAAELIEELPIGPDGLDGGPTEQRHYQT